MNVQLNLITPDGEPVSGLRLCDEKLASPAGGKVRWDDLALFFFWLR